MREIFKIIILLFVTNLTACQGLDDVMQGEDFTDYGNIELTFHGTTRATTTTISPEEAQHFLITITQGERIVRGPETLGTIDLRLPVGQGYKVYAESCSKEDAENSNEHWGQKRFTGSSAEFGINKGQTTKASIGMRVDNAAISVIIDASLANYFKNACTLNISESGRNLDWNYDNAGKGEGEDVMSDGQIAYFNVDETGQRSIRYTITASAEGNITNKEGTITLNRAKMSRLKLKKESGSFTLDVEVNQEEEELYVDQYLTIKPGDIISDDGNTDISGSNDKFESDNTIPDYDQYN